MNATPDPLQQQPKRNCCWLFKSCSYTLDNVFEVLAHFVWRPPSIKSPSSHVTSQETPVGSHVTTGWCHNLSQYTVLGSAIFAAQDPSAKSSQSHSKAIFYLPNVPHRKMRKAAALLVYLQVNVDLQ